MSKPSVFISHIHEETAIANAVGNLISRMFPDTFEVYIYSQEVRPGEKWFEALVEALQSCDICLVIATPDSIENPWVNFECGGAWATGSLIIPCCANHMTVAHLPEHLKPLTVIDLSSHSGLRTLMKELATKSGKKCPEATDYEAEAGKIKAIWCDTPEVTKIARRVSITVVQDDEQIYGGAIDTLHAQDWSSIQIVAPVGMWEKSGKNLNGYKLWRIILGTKIECALV